MYKLLAKIKKHRGWLYLHSFLRSSYIRWRTCRNGANQIEERYEKGKIIDGSIQAHRNGGVNRAFLKRVRYAHIKTYPGEQLSLGRISSLLLTFSAAARSSRLGVVDQEVGRQAMACLLAAARICC